MTRHTAVIRCTLTQPFTARSKGLTAFRGWRTVPRSRCVPRQLQHTLEPLLSSVTQAGSKDGVGPPLRCRRSLEQRASREHHFHLLPDSIRLIKCHKKAP